MRVLVAHLQRHAIAVTAPANGSDNPWWTCRDL